MTSPAKLLEAFAGLDAAHIQSRLSNADDKELALVLFYMAVGDRDGILARVSAAKARRVNEAIQRMAHVRYDPRAYESALSHLIEHLRAPRPLDAMKSHYRPI